MANMIRCSDCKKFEETKLIIEIIIDLRIKKEKVS